MEWRPVMGRLHLSGVQWDGLVYVMGIRGAATPVEVLAMGKRQLTDMELMLLMVETVGHSRAVQLVGAAVVGGLMGAWEWPGLGDRLQQLGYCQAAVYNLRADFRRVAERVAEVEGSDVGLGQMIFRTGQLRGLTAGVPG